jgi:hypothetical protein
MKNELKKILSSGGDERIYIREGGTNKYHINPVDNSNLVNRGSCTSGNLNPDTSAHLEDFAINSFKENFELEVQRHAAILKELYGGNGNQEFEVFFAPSGSDLVYYPLLFGRLLHPEKQCQNIITCPEELGSGSQIAAQGKYYSEYNQFGEAVGKSELIGGKITPDVYMLPARDENGCIIDNHNKLKQVIENDPDTPKIVSLVYGSKSGIEENLLIIDETDQPSILWAVDLCQFRNKKDLINGLLEKGAILLITGSKFYQSPPFCGALLVPKKLCDRLTKCDPTPARDFNRIFTKYDIPDCLPNLSKQFRSYKNIGLHMRWECALFEMIELDKLGEERIYRTISDWNEKITEAINKSTFFELMPDTKLTNKSIISFRIKYKDHYFDDDDLQSFYMAIVSKEFTLTDKRIKLFIGQPVQYQNGSFLRLAIGSYDIRQYVKTATVNYTNDLAIIRILEEEVKKFSIKRIPAE